MFAIGFYSLLIMHKPESTIKFGLCCILGLLQIHLLMFGIMELFREAFYISE